MNFFNREKFCLNWGRQARSAVTFLCTLRYSFSGSDLSATTLRVGCNVETLPAPSVLDADRWHVPLHLIDISFQKKRLASTCESRYRTAACSDIYICMHTHFTCKVAQKE
jgi:hypothetical protein